MEEKQEQFKKLAGILRKTFSEEELKEIQGFLARIADLLAEASTDSDRS